MTIASPLIPQSIAVLLLAMTRIGTTLMFIPGLGGRTVPTPLKVLAAGVLALVLLPFTPPVTQPLSDPAHFTVALAREFLLGLLMGFGIAVVFGAIEMAASLAGVQIGLNLGPIFDPALNAQATPLNTYYLVTAALVFFGTNGHHLVLLALHRSFQSVPIGGATLAGDAGSTITALASLMFADALRIGLPVAGTLLAVDAALGVLNRMVPQMNVFFVGLPVKVLAGFGVLLLTMPFLLRLLSTMVTSGIVEAIGRAGGVAR
ncbi:MAG: flagellar biosynthetic protein FliR [Sphaerobacter sp.]|nr:flagellar biosynthetic protein FliR [Sphaerobacter sp.]